MSCRIFSHVLTFMFIPAGPIPLRIREARVPIVNDNECVRKINTVTEKIFILPASSFCAGGEKGHDACQVRVLTILLFSHNYFYWSIPLEGQTVTFVYNYFVEQVIFKRKFNGSRRDKFSFFI